MSTASTAPDPTPIVVIGRGRAGRALAKALAAALPPRGRAKVPRVTIIPGRRPSRAAIARARTVVIAVPDPEIGRVAATIAPWLSPGAVVLHLAGSRGPEALLACAEAGAEIGVMHPLVAIPGRGAELAGTTFVIDGTRAATTVAARVATAVGASPRIAGVHGAAYHAAAAMLANGATALAASSARVLVQLGLSERDARVALGALLRSVADNVASQGPTAALTGPIVRGDAGTVGRHRDALLELDAVAPGAHGAPGTHGSVLGVYDAIAPVIVDLAREAGLDATAAGAITEALRPRSRSRSTPGRSR